jgi:hypothetical protein
MTLRSRLLALTVAAALVGCSDDDGLSPLAILGAWRYDGQRPMDGPWAADTIVLSAGGRGRAALHVLQPAPAGESGMVIRWQRADVFYRLDGDGVLLRICPDDAVSFGSCAPTYTMRGTLSRDGALYIGPTSSISSMSAQPWVRPGR